MAAEGASKVMKYLMFFFNFIFFVCGAVIIVGGALVLTKYSDYVQFTDSKGNAIPIFLIAVGVFIFITGFLGCCGAIKENYCMICVYAIIIVILLVAEVAGGIAGFVMRESIQEAIEDNMEEKMGNYTNQISIKKLFDLMQQDLKCCGTDNATEWDQYLGKGNVPDSCCKNETKDCGQKYKKENIFSKGCYMKLYELLKDSIFIIAGIAIAIALVQIFGVVCACCLMRSIKSEYEVV